MGRTRIFKCRSLGYENDGSMWRRGAFVHYGGVRCEKYRLGASSEHLLRTNKLDMSMSQNEVRHGKDVLERKV